MNTLLVIVLVYTTLSSVKTDICNPLATLIETNTFYLSQTHNKTLYLDLSNYEQAFSELSEKVKLFNANLQLFDEKSELIEPENITKFSNDFNIFPIEEDTKGYASFEACSKRNGSIITLTNENRKAIVDALAHFRMDKTPFRALPFYSLYSLHDFSHLDNFKYEHINPLWTISPPFITNQNVIEYPKARKPRPADYSTPKPNDPIPANVDTTIHDYSSKILCLKENNPWDLPENVDKWLELVPKIKTAIKTVNRVKNSFANSGNSLKTLPQTIKPIAMKLFKLILPDPLNSILSFIDKFSSKQNWEKSNLGSKDSFSKFIKDTTKIARLFNLSPQSFTKISDRKPSFKPLQLNLPDWIHLLELDEERYGINGPITIKPLSSLRDAQPSSRDAFEFEVSLRLYIFDRHSDKVTLYSVRPNNFQGYFTTAKTVIQNFHYITATPDELHPSECTTSPSELHPICNKLPLHSTPHFTFKKLATCGKILFNPNSETTDFWTSCPYQSVLTEPYIYRADCDNSGHSTTIINSDRPLTIDFFCDSELKLTRNFSAFPSTVKTDCEARINNSGTSHVALPQSVNDFFNDPVISDIYSPTTPTPIVNDTNLTLILSISIPVTFTLLLSISITIFCTCRRKPTLNRTLSQNQIRELQSFNQYPMLTQQ